MTYVRWKLLGKKRKETRLPNYDYPCEDDGGLHNPNLNAVCFDCRVSARYCLRGNVPICPHCRQKMMGIWCKDEIPRKTNKRGWALLARKFGRKGT